MQNSLHAVLFKRQILDRTEIIVCSVAKQQTWRQWMAVLDFCMSLTVCGATRRVAQENCTFQKLINNSWGKHQTILCLLDKFLVDFYNSDFQTMDLKQRERWWCKTNSLIGFVLEGNHGQLVLERSVYDL